MLQKRIESPSVPFDNWFKESSGVRDELDAARDDVFHNAESTPLVFNEDPVKSVGWVADVSDKNVIVFFETYDGCGVGADKVADDLGIDLFVDVAVDLSEELIVNS